MKRKCAYLKMRAHWLTLLLLSDFFFLFLVWLANPGAVKIFAVIMLLYSLLTAAAGYVVDKGKEGERLLAAEKFLERQGEGEEQELLAVMDSVWHPVIKETARLLRQERMYSRERQQELLRYQEFIEAWVHEIKTPLSLSELVLENRRDEMSDYVYRRIQHVQHMVRLDVERILYYARLYAEHVDYKFDKLFLRECVDEALADFCEVAEEKCVDVRIETEPVWIFSDQRALKFLLSQIFGNAFKYTRKAGGIVEVYGWKEKDGEKIHLAVRDNGEGVPKEDVPFLFDKGFTGNHPERQKATGMGLYFVKKYAELLGIEVKIEETINLDSGFGIELEFPIVLDS